MNILITGVNGLIGKAAANELLTKFKVIGCSRALKNTTGLEIDYYSIDISDNNSFNKLENKHIDIIVHCAASLDHNPLSEDLLSTNCNGIRNIAAFALKNNCKQFIYISGVPIIGKPITIPITETHVVNPLSNYHLTKHFGEIFLTNVLKNCNLTILRVPSPIGIDLNENKILPVFIRKSINNEDITLAGTGNRIQNYIDVKDVAKSVELVILKNVSGLYNIAAKKSYSNKELAEICIKLFNSSSKIDYKGIDPEEENKWIVSIEKAKNEFNFNPVISIESSILEMSKRLIQ